MKPAENESVFRKIKKNNALKARLRALKYIGILLGLIVAFLLVIVFVFFRVHHYDITGNTAGYDVEMLAVSTGIKYNSNIYAANLRTAEEKILKDYPFVQSVKITRNIPTTIKIELKCDPTAYYIDIENEYFILTSDLRIAGRYKELDKLKEAYPDAKKFVCSDIKRAVRGERIQFMDSKYYDECMTVLDSVERSDVFPQVTGINMKNKFDVQLIYDDRFKALLGGSGDFALKLSFLSEIMKDMEGSKGTVDVSDAETGYVIINNAVTFSE